MDSVNDAPASPKLSLLTQEFSSPWENLACDEALLDYCEQSASEGFLRFWESREYFVVLGYSKKIENEVYRERCAALGIPILRRCSGGGTVLQGPGCLNYALVLPIESHQELTTITGANRHIMERIRDALARVTGQTIAIQGDTDLTIDGRKVSGNAQRRKRRFLLFHGGFLLKFDLALIAQTLRLPLQQPAYRAQRNHHEFLANLDMKPAAAIQALRLEWNACTAEPAAITPNIASIMEQLKDSKYGRPDWITG
jgi:lipoate---protein ligase